MGSRLPPADKHQWCNLLGVDYMKMREVERTVIQLEAILRNEIDAEPKYPAVNVIRDTVIQSLSRIGNLANRARAHEFRVCSNGSTYSPDKDSVMAHLSNFEWTYEFENQLPTCIVYQKLSVIEGKRNRQYYIGIITKI